MPGLLALLSLLPLLTRLLALLSLLSLLALLIRRLLLRRFPARELLHLPLQFFRLAAQHFLLPALPERLLLILLVGQLLLAASQVREFLQRGVNFLGAAVGSGLLTRFILILFAIQLQIREVLQIAAHIAARASTAARSERHLDIAEGVFGAQGMLQRLLGRYQRLVPFLRP